MQNDAMNTERVRLDVRDGVATVTLDRPEAANALDLDMARALLRAAISCSENPAVRAVVLQATGSRFCVGGDVRSFVDAGSEAGRLLKEVTHHLHGALIRFAHMDAPLVTIVRGVAAGAGMGLAIAGDIVLATPAASFYPAYLAAALSPDAGLTYLLPRLVGARRAQQILLRNVALDAQAALQAGLATQIVDEASMSDTVREITQAFVHAPREALAATKRLLRASMNATFETQLDAESQSIARLALRPDGQEGLRAVLAKRKAVFSS